MKLIIPICLYGNFHDNQNCFDCNFGIYSNRIDIYFEVVLYGCAHNMPGFYILDINDSFCSSCYMATYDDLISHPITCMLD